MLTQQTIVVRKDLKMRKGKIASQVAHASMKVILDQGNWLEDDCLIISVTPEQKEWINGIFTKIVLGCDSESDIHSLAERAKRLDIPYAIITDCGKTEFHGIPTVTCIAIGPYRSILVKDMTSEYKLL
jgi:PTH2 family peptidyl-tRNA hydrolase